MFSIYSFSQMSRASCCWAISPWRRRRTRTMTTTPCARHRRAMWSSKMPTLWSTASPAYARNPKILRYVWRTGWIQTIPIPSILYITHKWVRCGVLLLPPKDSIGTFSNSSWAVMCLCEKDKIRLFAAPLVKEGNVFECTVCLTIQWGTMIRRM